MSIPAIPRPLLRRAVAAGALALLPAACRAQGPSGPAPRSPTPAAVADAATATPVVSGIDRGWGFAFLPDGRMLVTEKAGRLRVADRDGRLGAPLQGVPAVWATGQGGLLDVVLDPQFATNRLVYLSFAEAGEDGTAGTAVARGRLNADATALEGTQTIYRQLPKLRGPNHFGSRLVFRRDGTLLVTQGDRFDYREQAQQLGSLVGKAVRVNADGSIPRDNPYVGQQGARPELWAIGLRNVQAAALHPQTGDLWTVMHGAKGGDELNRTEGGKNYGWPVISYGVNYDGSPIGTGRAEQAGMEQPVYYWDPVIAPSGAAFYTGERHPAWRGSLFVGSLKPGGVVRLVMENGRVAREERWLPALGRVRDVRQSPDGELYVLTDGPNGRILRVAPGAAGPAR